MREKILRMSERFRLSEGDRRPTNRRSDVATKKKNKKINRQIRNGEVVVADDGLLFVRNNPGPNALGRFSFKRIPGFLRTPRQVRAIFDTLQYITLCVRACVCVCVRVRACVCVSECVHVYTEVCRISRGSVPVSVKIRENPGKWIYPPHSVRACFVRIEGEIPQEKANPRMFR